MSSRYLQDLEKRKTKIIHIYRNGDPYTRATFVILRLGEQMDLERIINAIEEKVRLPLNKPIRKLFEINGTLVQSHTQVEDGKYYVAASAENFFSIDYGHQANWVLVGPVRISKYANVRYVTKSEDERQPAKLSSSNNVLSAMKSTSSNTTSKKPQNRKTVQSLKKLPASKKYPDKKMSASEHVDNGLSEVIPAEVVITNGKAEEKKDNEIPLKDEVEQEIQEKEPLQTMDTEKEESLEMSPLPASSYNNEIETDNEKVKLEQMPSDSLENRINTENEIHEEINVDKNDGKEQDLDSIKDVTSDILLDDESSKDGISKKTPDETESTAVENESLPNPQSEENEFSDQVYNEAATKIQATFRGYQVRSEMERSKTNEFPEDSISENPDLSETTNEINDSL